MNLKLAVYLISLIASLLSVIIVLRIVKRTEKRLNRVYLLLLVAFLLLSGFSLASFASSQGIYNADLLEDVFLVAFGVVAFASMLGMEQVVRDVTDRGQVLMELPGKDLAGRIIDSARRLRGPLCYVSLTQPCEKSREMLANAGVKINGFHFIGLSGERDESTEVMPEPSRLGEHLLSELGEKNFKFLLVDDLSSLRLEPMELERWVSQVTTKARAMRTQSLLFVNSGNVPQDVAKDLGMFMDKVMVMEEAK